MKYGNISPAEFISRPNRFIALVRKGGETLTVHVKNTGRCRELLIPGCTVYLEKSCLTEKRKTLYDLVSVEKEGRIINIDSQAPNKLVSEWLKDHFRGAAKPEYTWGSSRFDFLLRPEGGTPEEILMEVKGCTLIKNGTGYFPDAPTERGARHIHELISAKKKGLGSVLAFVIQTEGIVNVLPNRETDPWFSKTLDDALKEGVTVIYFACSVSCGGIVITGGTAANETDISKLLIS